jgi:hypothetical protein
MNPNYTDSGWVVKIERRKYKTNKVIERIMSHLERKKINLPSARNANACYFSTLSDIQGKIPNETKISLGHPACVVQRDIRGTQTQTDGTVVPSGCKLDVSSMAEIRINIP